MPLTDQDLKALREVATAARTGDKGWREGTKNVWCEATDECVAATWRNQLSNDKQLAIAKFIAKFDPQTVLSLLDEIERLRADVTKFSTLADERHDALCAERRRYDELRAEFPKKPKR